MSNQKIDLDELTADQRASYEHMPEHDREFVKSIHTGTAPEGERPLLKKSAPEYVGGREMLDILWHKSPWAPVDDAFDHGLNYFLQFDPDQLFFRDFVIKAIAHGILEVNAKIGADEFREILELHLPERTIFDSLLKGLFVKCEVLRTNADRAFRHNAPTEMVDSALWFNREDVDYLSCDADAVRDVVEVAALADTQSDANAAVAAAIRSTMGWPVTLDAQGDGTDLPSTESPIVAAPEPVPNTDATVTTTLKRGPPSDLSDRYKEALWATLVELGSGKIANPLELRRRTDQRLVAGGNGGESEDNKGLIPSQNTARKAAVEVWDAYKRGEDSIQPMH